MIQGTGVVLAIVAVGLITLTARRAVTGEYEDEVAIMMLDIIGGIIIIN